MPPLVVAIVVLTLATGAIHLYLATEYLGAGLTADGVQFVGMAVPYLVGAALVASGFHRRRWLRLGMAYVLVLLAAWALLGARTPVAYLDKLIEVVLLGLLAWSELHAPATSTASSE